ncbi:MAG TPA: YceI family protein [Gammaproteobacteria bacterium]|nr:YceI family protein [Gammaproteobacteria bacterium]
MTINRLRRMGMLAVACTGIAFAGSAIAGTSEWNVVKDSSSVKFTGTQEGSQFTGVFPDFTAKIAFDPAHPAQGHIVGDVKTATVNTQDSDRDSQLPDADWLNSQQYPQAHFESKSISKGSDGNYVADGSLTLKGMTKPAKLTFTFKTAGASGAKFDGKLTINRFDYNVGQSVSDPNFVGQNVDVAISLDLKK